MIYEPSCEERKSMHNPHTLRKMRILKPLQGVRSPLHYFLLAELPTLIITVALLSWALAALSDVLRFQRLSGNWTSNDESGYGFELGTQLITVTSTRTGTSNAYSAIPSTRTFTSWSVYTENGTRRTETIPTQQPTSGSSLYSSTSGTFTTTYTKSIYPYVWGTAYYSDVYAKASVKPSEAAMVTPTRVRREPAAAPTAAPESNLARRDATWGGGYNYESSNDGLYHVYGEAENDFSLWVGMFSGCLAFVVLRLLVSIGYLITCHIYNAPEHKQHLETDRVRSLQVALHAVNTILAFAVLGWVMLCGLGITAWCFFGFWQNVHSASILATLVFYALTTVTSFVVLVLSARRVDMLNKEKKRLRQEMGADRPGHRISSTQTSMDHA